MPKGEWLTVQKAAVLLEVSAKTVRRRVQNGRYRTKRVRGKFGTERRIRKEDVLKDVQPSDTPGQGEVTQDNPERKEDTPGQAKRGDIPPDAPQNQEVRKQLRVLVVDESQKAVHLLSRVLGRRSVEIAVATDGEEGLRMMEEEQPDLAIIEIAIPKLDGFELAIERDGMGKTRSLPIVFHSYLLREHALVEQARGYPNVIGCFRKPLRGKQLEQLKELIEDMRTTPDKYREMPHR